MQSDLGAVHVTNLRGGTSSDLESRFSDTASHRMETTEESFKDTTADIRLLCRDFLTNYTIGNVFFYLELLRENLSAGIFFLELHLDHVQQYSNSLLNAFLVSPTRALPLMEHTAWEVAAQRGFFPSFARHSSIQVQLFWEVTPISLRQLAKNNNTIAQLICVSGIVVRTSASHAQCIRAAIQCSSCRSKTYINGGRTVDLPPQCLANHGPGGSSDVLGGTVGGGSGKCRPNPYVLLPMECEYEDQQVIKLQELPEDVPTGELPRHVTVMVDRYLVDRVSPGNRVRVVGIVSVQDRKGTGDGNRKTAGLRAQYLRATGLMFFGSYEDGTTCVSVNESFSSRVRSRNTLRWKPEEEAAFKAFAGAGGVYEKLSRSIDPAIFGLQDQKKAIVCLLFGGTRKRQGNNYLRGDMNVLLIGDPSTAKSQLLKFTEKVAPIGIYTSGKGSSAAGLTATVVSGGKGDFSLEAGSMVLADGGVICIDEFDKMRDQDQVAIHEAMEQQTISIAKANLTTMLNSRTSVLAAANPSLGSYDPLRSNEEQMDFQSSILSRFDLIFKVIDPRDPEIDNRLAQHVVNMHKGAMQGRGRRAKATERPSGPEGGRKGELSDAMDGTVDRHFFSKYISYAKATCHSTISEEAASILLDFYVQVRREAHQRTLEAVASSGGGGGAPIIQITARQLESLVRITESLAKMRLDPKANRADAEEAIRLFKTATVDAINSGVTETQLSEGQTELVLKIEDALRRRVAMGATVEHQRLVSELRKIGFEGSLIDRAIFAMVRREELEWRKQRSLLYRAR